MANSCRQTLLNFGVEIRALYDLELDPDTKQGDVKAVLQKAVETFASTGQFADSLTKLMLGTWSHTQSLLHRGSTTRAEAIRLYVWTGLLVNEVWGLLRGALST